MTQMLERPLAVEDTGPAEVLSPQASHYLNLVRVKNAAVKLIEDALEKGFEPDDDLDVYFFDTLNRLWDKAEETGDYRYFNPENPVKSEPNLPRELGEPLRLQEVAWETYVYTLAKLMAQQMDMGYMPEEVADDGRDLVIRSMQSAALRRLAL